MDGEGLDDVGDFYRGYGTCGTEQDVDFGVVEVDVVHVFGCCCLRWDRLVLVLDWCDV